MACRDILNQINQSALKSIARSDAVASKVKTSTFDSKALEKAKYLAKARNKAIDKKRLCSNHNIVSLMQFKYSCKETFG